MPNQPENDHLSPENFFHFIDGGLEGCTWGLVERHLIDCEECLGTLALIVRAGAPIGRNPGKFDGTPFPSQPENKYI